MAVKEIMTAVVAVGSMALVAATPAKAATNKNMEKCYGIAKKAMNDCGNAAHACAGQAKRNGEKTEWIFVPKGVCNKIVGGSTKST